MEGIFNNRSYRNENVMEIIVSIFFVDTITKERRNQRVSHVRERVNIKVWREILCPNMEDKKIREDWSEKNKRREEKQIKGKPGKQTVPRCDGLYTHKMHMVCTPPSGQLKTHRGHEENYAGGPLLRLQLCSHVDLLVIYFRRFNWSNNSNFASFTVKRKFESDKSMYK